MNSLHAEVGTIHSSTGAEKPIHKLLNNLRNVSPPLRNFVLQTGGVLELF